MSSRLRGAGLIGAPRQWGPLAEAVGRFRANYARAYLAHHEEYHAKMGLLGHRTEEIVRQARALARLNSVAELGTPGATDLPGMAEELRILVRSCGLALDAETIASGALCPSCAINLGDTPPVDEVAALAGYVGEGLQRQNERLSGRLIDRRLGRQAQGRLERFVQVVGVSDLYGLANVLDDELTSFVGALLREPAGA